MNYSDLPPTYEEAICQNDSYYVREWSDQHYTLKGPDAVCRGQYFLFADFIPWSDYTSSPEELCFLLRRVNNWLSTNAHFRVTKCEFVPRMLDSRRRFDSSHCYIFNMTNGRTIFINQLRLHISVDVSKTDPDHICIKTYIPEIVNDGFIHVGIISSHYRPGIDKPIFEDMSLLMSKVNTDIKRGIISGEITNVSTFYHQVRNETHSLKDTVFYRESIEPKFSVKSLRVFYKFGKPIQGTLCMKSFNTMNENNTLDELVENATCYINTMNTENFISMETFPELQEANQTGSQNTVINDNCTLVYGERFVRVQSIKVYHLIESKSFLRPFPFESGSPKIFWIVPRKIKNTYENYNSFISYVDYVIKIQDNCILDMETLMIPNALTWSQVRHQTITTYYNEPSTNYHIYVIRLILKKDSVISTKDAPAPYYTLTESSNNCHVS